MSFRDWESDVEFYEEVGGELVVRPDRPFNRSSFSRSKKFNILEEAGIGLVESLDSPFEELPFAHFDAQDSVITYSSSNNREVYMRVMGFAAVNPIVFARVITPGGKELLRRGELIGSQHPEERILIPGVLRTQHPPLIREVGWGSGSNVLPIPLSHLRAQKPRR